MESWTLLSLRQRYSSTPRARSATGCTPVRRLPDVEESRLVLCSMRKNYVYHDAIVRPVTANYGRRNGACTHQFCILSVQNRDIRRRNNGPSIELVFREFAQYVLAV